MGVEREQLIKGRRKIFEPTIRSGHRAQYYRVVVLSSGKKGKKNKKTGRGKNKEHKGCRAGGG